DCDTIDGGPARYRRHHQCHAWPGAADIVKRRLLGLSLLGIVAWLIFILAMLPARFVLAQFGSLLPPDIRLHGVQGTLWNGTAQTLAWRGVSAGPLHWDVQAVALLTGHLQADINAKLPQG